MPETLIYCPVKCTLVYRRAEHRPARRVQEASQRALPGLRAGERVWTGNLPGAHSSLLRAETGTTGCVDVTVDNEGYDHNKVEGIPSSQSLYNQVQLSENQ